MIKKYTMSNVNQCKKQEDGFSKIVKIAADEKKYVYGKIEDDWNNCNLSFVSYIDLTGNRFSIPKTNIEYVEHGYSKWSLNFNSRARVEGAELGKLRGYLCINSNIVVDFSSSGDADARPWAFNDKEGLFVEVK